MPSFSLLNYYKPLLVLLLLLLLLLIDPPPLPARPAAKTVMRTGSGGILMVGAIRPINPILKPKEDDDDVANYTYMKVKPLPHDDDDDDEKKKGHDENIRGGGGSSSIVEACLPKGFKPSSAPSRYINYQPLGSSSSCFSGKVGNAP